MGININKNHQRERTEKEVNLQKKNVNGIEDEGNSSLTQTDCMRLKSAHLGNDYEGKLGEDQHICDAEPIERSVSAKDSDKYELCEKDDCKRWIPKKTTVDGSPLRSRHCSEKQ